MKNRSLKNRPLRCGAATSVLALLFASAIANAQAAETVSPNDPLLRKLGKPMTSIVDGQPFRDGLQRIATAADVNLLLDRHVDPTATIAAGPLGPSVGEALTGLAETQGCVMTPARNIVLIGRKSWVDQMLVLLTTLPEKPTRTIDVSWEDLRTPTEALSAASPGFDLQPRPPLPHDLWPAANWKRIDPRVAITLILGQCGRYIDRKNVRGAVLPHRPLPDADRVVRISRRYMIPDDDDRRNIRNAIEQADSRAQVKSSARGLTAIARPVAHRAAAQALLQQLAPQDPPQPAAARFTLKEMSTSANNALQQLVRAAGKKMVIDPSAAEAIQTRVTIAGKDVTLKSLIEEVAKQAGLRAQWSDATVTITLSRAQ